MYYFVNRLKTVENIQKKSYLFIIQLRFLFFYLAYKKQILFIPIILLSYFVYLPYFMTFLCLTYTFERDNAIQAHKCQNMLLSYPL